MNKDLETDNAVVLSNAVELASQIVMRVAGQDISNTFGGETVTPAALRGALTARIQFYLSKKGVGQ